MIAHTGHKRYQLGKVPPIQLELSYLFSSNRSAHLGGLCIYLGQAFALHGHFFLDVAHLQGNIDAGILGHTEGDTFGLISAESRDGNRDVVLSRSQGRSQVFAVGVGHKVARRSLSDILNHDARFGQDCSSRVPHRPGERCGILCRGKMNKK